MVSLYCLSNGVNISDLPREYALFGQGTLFGLPFQLIAIYIPMLIIIWYLSSRSHYGYQLYLTGTNDTAARLSGINITRVRIMTYASAGFLSAIAGIIGSSRFMTARPDAGAMFNLQSITVAVLGGVSIFGGKGTIIGTALATIVITMLAYIFNLININAVFQVGTIGIILILVVLFQYRIGNLNLKQIFSFKNKQSNR